MQQSCTDAGRANGISGLRTDLPRFHTRPRLIPAGPLAIQVGSPADQLSCNALRECEIVLAPARRPEAHEEFNHRGGAAALTHDVPRARRRFFRNSALHDSIGQSLRPLFVSLVPRDRVELEEGSNGSSGTMTEAEVVDIGKIWKAIRYQGSVAVNDRNALQVLGTLSRGIQVFWILRRAI